MEQKNRRRAISLCCQPSLPHTPAGAAAPARSALFFSLSLLLPFLFCLTLPFFLSLFPLPVDRDELIPGLCFFFFFFCLAQRCFTLFPGRGWTVTLKTRSKLSNGSGEGKKKRWNLEGGVGGGLWRQTNRVWEVGDGGKLKLAGCADGWETAIVCVGKGQLWFQGHGKHFLLCPVLLSTLPRVVPLWKIWGSLGRGLGGVGGLGRRRRLS